MARHDKIKKETENLSQAQRTTGNVQRKNSKPIRCALSVKHCTEKMSISLLDREMPFCYRYRLEKGLAELSEQAPRRPGDEPWL